MMAPASSDEHERGGVLVVSLAWATQRHVWRGENPPAPRNSVPTVALDEIV